MSRAYKFVQVDVFTDRVFGGNPLAVFLDGQGLSDQEMALITKEMNLSETTFILPATNADCAVKVRIFTPATEMPFAGHPTIGTTYVLATHGMLPAEARQLNLEENIGPIAVRLEGAPQAPSFIWMQHRAAEFKPFKGKPAQLLQAIGLSEDDLLPGTPIEMGSTGVPFAFVPLKDKETVDRAKPNSSAISAALSKDDVGGLYITAPDPAANSAYSRMFAADTMDIAEDPATGAASGPLGAYLQRHSLVADTNAAVIDILNEQGTKMGRQSFIHIRLTRQDEGSYKIEIGGQAVPVFEGTLTLA